ncbi:tetratricopeptide repeat protein [Nonomuraea angiospora]|uniref:tetratricopeptide repeat protein n=1 Tax=Nonomuraea angiospora TaxID=46172 RepID=UPI0034368C7C
MGGDGRRRWAASPVAMVAIPVAIGLVGNLATSTVEIEAWWWLPLTWTVTALLVGAAVVSQIAQSRPADRGAPDGAPVMVASPPTVKESDPIALGVHPAIAIDLAIERPELSRRLPTYVQRDHDRLLWHLLDGPEHSALVMLVGTSSTGKTRSAYEAVANCLPDWTLLHPMHATDLLATLEGGVEPRTVLWLNESQVYFEGDHGEAAAAEIRRFLTATSEVVVIGSMWPEYWFAYTRMPRPGTPDPHHQVRALLENATKISVPDAFTPTELKNAHQIAERDSRLATALTGLDNGYGVTQILSGGPDLMSRWEDAPDPYRRAVVNAAIDARRLGHLSPLSAELLRKLSAASLSEPQRAGAPPGWFEESLAYACEPLRGGISLLTATSPAENRVEGYVLADFIDQQGRAARRCSPVSDEMWRALAVHTGDADDLERLGASASSRGRYPQALALWRASFARGRLSTWSPLWQLLGQMGRSREAEDVLRQASDSGDVHAQQLLLAMLRRARRGGEIEQALRGMAANGNPQAERELAILLHNGGRKREAEQLLRTAFHRGDRSAARLLLILLQRCGRTNEAEEIGRLLDTQAVVMPTRRQPELSTWQLLERDMRAATAFPEAVSALLHLLRQRHPGFDGERLRRRMMAGRFNEASKELAGLFGEEPMRGKALRALDDVRAAPEEDPGLGLLLADLLLKDDRQAEAEHLLRRLVDLDYQALSALADLLTKSGRREACVEVLQAGIGPHGAKARYLLAQVHRDLGRDEESDRLLRSAAAEGADAAIQELVRRLLKGGHIAEVVDMVRAASRAGRAESVRRAAVLLFNAGRTEEALSLLRDAIVLCGNAEALPLLMLMLIRTDRTEEAAAISRRGLTFDGSTVSESS